MLIYLINSLVVIPVIFFSFFLAENLPQNQVAVRPQKMENKGIYLTAYTAGSPENRKKLVELVNQTELNSMVIDLKDYSGLVFFDTDNPLAEKIGSKDVRIPDLVEWLKKLKKMGIYTIARIVVFQDPYLAKMRPDIALKDKSGGIWRDRKGLSWVDPTQKLVWDYNLFLAKEAVNLGFNEVNFDYIRFPSDGNIKNIVYANLDNPENKANSIAEFYRYVSQNMAFYPALTSADLFGMVLWRDDGLNIGQRFKDAVSHFDYICPMVYPSHFPDGFEGFANPADHPYEIIYRSLIRVEDNLANSSTKVRPWLQAFDLGAEYTPGMIKKEIKAANDSGGYGWLLWNASNQYNEGGLEVE